MCRHIKKQKHKQKNKKQEISENVSEVICDFSNIAGYKSYIEKSITFIYVNYEYVNNEYMIN